MKNFPENLSLFIQNFLEILFKISIIFTLNFPRNFFKYYANFTHYQNFTKTASKVFQDFSLTIEYYVRKFY